jgi:hypothetical protein
MAKVQLYAINNSGETVLLQLSDESPIKVNLSVASLDAFAPSSYFSQTFQIPGQGVNGEFFKDVYNVNGYSFDASKVAQAWINNDGSLFTIGNLNLKSVIVNERTGMITYEVFFMGDTSNFSASVGNGFMNEINTKTLDHELTYANVTSSWGATAGGGTFKDGDVLYPLVEWGYNYNSDNFPINATISVGFPRGSTGTDGGGSFTNGTTGALRLQQMKPAVRIKWIWDKIFEDAGYKYASDFLNSDKFKSLYFVSDSIARVEQPAVFARFEASGNQFSTPVNTEVRILYPNVILNPVLAYDPTTSAYTAGATGTYAFAFRGNMKTTESLQGVGNVFLFIDYANGSQTTYTYPIIKTNPVNGVGSWNHNVTMTLGPGDKVYTTFQHVYYSSPTTYCYNTVFECLVAPSYVVVSGFFPPQGTTKKIDFIRGITKMFNLVFEPGRDQNKSFTITPWIDWIQKGGKDDWTQFLDGSFDSPQQAPFLDQTRAVDFTGTDDADFQNNIYQEQYKRNYMFREFESGINLIKGTEEIKVPFAPTPLESIPVKNGAYPNWVVPSVAKLLPGDPNENKSAKVQPIQPKPRILFYNGLKSTPVSWYLNDSVYVGATGTSQNQYPLVSQYETFPPDVFTFDLTFQSKAPLWSPLSSYIGRTGVDIYTTYWEDYIGWLYDPYNRKKTARLRLNPLQITELKFNTKYWIKDAWWFVSKIANYPVGDCALVDVELIKVPSLAIPRIGQGATAAPVPGSSCKTVAICNNNTIEFAEEVYTYVDCNGNNQSIRVLPLTCAQICLLWPNPLPLPAGWTGQPLGDCGPLGPVILGPQVFVDFASQGYAGQETSLKISGASGGTAGTYLPIQYFNTLGNEGVTGIFIQVPYDWGVQAELSWINAEPYSFVEGEYLFMKQNDVIVASSSYSGFYAGGITAAYPTGLTSADYQIVSFLSGTGPFPPTGCPIWSIDTDTFGSSTTIWNECPNTVWNTDPDNWNLSTTIWNI